MNQKITIVIDGMDGVPPDSVGTVLEAVFALLESMDKKSWKVGTPRIKWRVADAKLVNPFSITAVGQDLFEEYPASELALSFVEQLQQIENGVLPKFFDDCDLKLAKRLGLEAKRSRHLAITGSENGRQETFEVPRVFWKHVSKLMKQPKQITTQYASLDGTLIQLSNDPLKADGTAKLRERTDGAEVNCHADPEVAARMAHYLNRQTRVVLYGIVTYENEVPKRIQVEDFTALPSDNDLPTLDDLHAMRLRPPRGMNPEDFLDNLRGDD
jgi:hypothetical protein